MSMLYEIEVLFLAGLVLSFVHLTICLFVLMGFLVAVFWLIGWFWFGWF